MTNPEDGPVMRSNDNLPAVVSNLASKDEYTVRNILFDEQWLEWATDIDYSEID